MVNEDDVSMVKYIHRRISNNKNFLCTITGATGSGKSWTALSICEMLDKEFNIDRVVFSGRELMNLINSDKLHAGSTIVWDEAGIDLSNRNWQSLTNKMLNYLLQTFRHKNFILFFTVPYADFIDSAMKKLFHGDFETVKIDKFNNTVIIKPKLLQYNTALQKWYRKYLKRKFENKFISMKRWAVKKPSDELIAAYEKKKNEFTRKLNNEISEKLEKVEPVKEKKPVGTPVTCDKCGHNWYYNGKPTPLIGCPSCQRRMKNPNFVYIQFPEQQQSEKAQLNLSSIEKNENLLPSL